MQQQFNSNFQIKHKNTKLHSGDTQKSINIEQQQQNSTATQKTKNQKCQTESINIITLRTHQH